MPTKGAPQPTACASPPHRGGEAAMRCAEDVNPVASTSEGIQHGAAARLPWSRRSGASASTGTLGRIRLTRKGAPQPTAYAWCPDAVTGTSACSRAQGERALPYSLAWPRAAALCLFRLRSASSSGRDPITDRSGPRPGRAVLRPVERDAVAFWWWCWGGNSRVQTHGLGECGDGDRDGRSLACDAGRRLPGKSFLGRCSPCGAGRSCGRNPRRRSETLLPAKREVLRFGWGQKERSV
jgi:hypothetical protein